MGKFRILLTPFDVTRKLGSYQWSGKELFNVLMWQHEYRIHDLKLFVILSSTSVEIINNNYVIVTGMGGA